MNASRIVRWCICAIVLVMAWSQSGFAATVVNWQGGYVTTNKAFNRNRITDTGFFGGDAAARDMRTLLTYDESSTLSPTSGYSGKSFHGGYQFINFDQTSIECNYARQVFNQSSTDYIELNARPGAYGGAAQFVLTFLKANFLNSGSANRVCLDANNTSIVIDFRALTNFTTRLLVKNAGTFYLSNATITSDAEFTLTNPTTSTTWAVYDPVASLDFSAASATFSRVWLKDVEAIGYYVENDGMAASVWSTSNLYQLTATANFAPNPALPLPSAGAMGVVLAALVGLRRRGRS